MKKILTILLCFGWGFAFSQNQPVYERAWGTYFGGQHTLLADSAIDNGGNSYLVGMVSGDATYLNNFTTLGTQQPDFAGGVSDGFIAKFTPDGLLEWCTYFGGSEADYIYSVTIDGNGNIVVGGNTGSAGLATSGVHQTTLAGGGDAFVAKFGATGILIWCTYYGGDQSEYLRNVDTDSEGNIYIGGHTSSPTGIATAGTFHPEHTFVEPDQMGFIAKLNENGLREWGSYYGSNIYDENLILTDHSTISAIAVNDSGVFVTGEAYESPNNIFYFATPNAHQPTAGGAGGTGIDLYLSKFHLDNGQREWSTYYGGSSVEFGIMHPGNDFTRHRKNLVASTNYVYLGGGTWSNNNIATVGSFKPSKTTIVSQFITKFDMQGLRMWGTYLGESNITMTTLDHNLSSLPANSRFMYYPSLIQLSLDKQGNVMASGSTIMDDLSSEGSYQETRNEDCNCTDAYMTKISSDGSSLIYGTYYGGEYNDTAAKTFFEGDNFYMAGQTQSYFDIATPGSFQEELDFLENNPTEFPTNAFLVKFSPPTASIDEMAASKSLVYPNPSSGSFMVNLNENYIDGELQLYDLNGKLVHSQGIGSITSQVEVSGNLKGVYLLKISNKNLYHVKKIIIE